LLTTKKRVRCVVIELNSSTPFDSGDRDLGCGCLSAQHTVAAGAHKKKRCQITRKSGTRARGRDELTAISCAFPSHCWLQPQARTRFSGKPAEYTPDSTRDLS
ncbi:unnamed protein product, partial [Ectocarpus sp. 12 AP-2014]